MTSLLLGHKPQSQHLNPGTVVVSSSSCCSPEFSTAWLSPCQLQELFWRSKYLQILNVIRCAWWSYAKTAEKRCQGKVRAWRDSGHSLVSTAGCIWQLLASWPWIPSLCSTYRKVVFQLTYVVQIYPLLWKHRCEKEPTPLLHILRYLQVVFERREEP